MDAELMLPYTLTSGRGAGASGARYRPRSVGTVAGGGGGGTVVGAAVVGGAVSGTVVAGSVEVVVASVVLVVEVEVKVGLSALTRAGSSWPQAARTSALPRPRARIRRTRVGRSFVTADQATQPPRRRGGAA